MMKVSLTTLLSCCLLFLSGCQECEDPIFCWKPPYEPCPDHITDKRDSLTYDVVEISVDIDGDTKFQCWMAQNLNYGQEISHSVYQHRERGVQKYCYDDNPQNCIKYGGLYYWHEATKEAICPKGWRVPSHEDFKSLEKMLGMGAEAENCGIRGTDQAYQLISRQENCPNCQNSKDQGFNALFAGECSIAQCGGLGVHARFLTSTESSPVNFYARILDPQNQGKIECRERNKEVALSVRCIKNLSN